MGRAVMSDAVQRDSGRQVSLLESGAPGDDPRAFRRCLGQYPTGVAVMTASDGSAMAGMSANSFAAVSLDPPLILWSIRRESVSVPVFRAATHYAVNVLSADQASVAMHFATPAADKFDTAEWEAGLGNAPLLSGCIAHLECKVHNVIEGGDHLILIGLVERYARYQGEPLLFSQGRYAVSQEHPDLAATPGAGTVPPVSELPFNLEEASLMKLANFAAHRLTARFNECIEDEGAGQTQRRLLGWLRHGPRSAEQLVTLTFLGQGNLMDELQAMVQNGDAVVDLDGRYELTSAGHAKARHVAERVVEFEKDIVQSTAEAEVRAMRDMLVKLAHLTGKAEKRVVA